MMPEISRNVTLKLGFLMEIRLLFPCISGFRNISMTEKPLETPMNDDTRKTLETEDSV